MITQQEEQLQNHTLHATASHGIQAHSAIKAIVEGKVELGTIVSVCGWLRSRRDSKAGMSFLTINDGSSFTSLQVIAHNNLDNYASDILTLTKDCALQIFGVLKASPGASQSVELVASKVVVVGTVKNPETYPISPKHHSVEYLRDYAHLRIRTNLFGAIARVRNTVSTAIHQYLQQNGFVWVHTPIITTADAEGAGELFNVTTFDLNNIASIPKQSDGTVDFKQDFFAKQAFLTVSGQLNVEAYSLALSKVYTFAPTFRAEKSNTTRHLAEFWMIEPEVAFADLATIAKIAEELLRYVFQQVLANNPADMDFFAQFIHKDAIIRLQNLVKQDFVRISYTEAIDKLLHANKKFDNPVYWGVDLSSEHERWLCEEYVGGPTIVTDYPQEIKAFYMRANDDGKTVAAMDILVPGIGEIVGGSAREERYDLLAKRMQELNMSTDELAWYLDLRQFGSAPHAGFGVGLDRLVSYITQVANVRDITPFPRAYRLANY